MSKYLTVFRYKENELSLDRKELIFLFNHEFIKMNWKRYLDDCFIIWNKEESNLNIVYTILNNLDPDINFTMEKSSSEIHFLDVLVRISNNQLSTDIV